MLIVLIVSLISLNCYVTSTNYAELCGINMMTELKIKDRKKELPESGFKNFSFQDVNFTDAELHPWIVSYGRRIRDDWEHTCGGSIISKDLVLTTHTCTLHFQNNGKIRAGDNNLKSNLDDEGVQEVDVVDVIPHPLRTSDSKSAFYDLAVLKVYPPFHFTNTVRRICLPDYNESDRQNLVAYVGGFGDTEVGKLTSVLLTIWSDSFCNKIYNANKICTLRQKMHPNVHCTDEKRKFSDEIVSNKFVDHERIQSAGEGQYQRDGQQKFGSIFSINPEYSVVREPGRNQNLQIELRKVTDSKFVHWGLGAPVFQDETFQVRMTPEASTQTPSPTIATTTRTTTVTTTTTTTAITTSTSSEDRRIDQEELKNFERVIQLLPDNFNASLRCIGSEIRGVGACRGDEGGPGYIFNTGNKVNEEKFVQITVFQGSIGCGQPRHPGIHVNLEEAETLAFIKKLLE